MTDWDAVVLTSPLLLAPPIGLYLLIYLYRRRGWRDVPLMLTIGAGTIWATGYGVELLAPTLESKALAGRLEYPGIALAPLGWLLLGLQLQNQLHRLRKWTVALLLIIPAATLIQVYTSDFHDFFWRSKRLVSWGDLTLIRNVYGPGFWIHLVYGYVLNLAGAGLILATILQSGTFYVGQRISLAVALVLPWTANMLYVFKVGDVPLDFTPLAIIVSGLTLVIGVFRYHLGDIVPVAREYVVSEMQDGVMVFDDQDRLIDANRAALALLGSTEVPLGQTARSLFHDDRLATLLKRREGSESILSDEKNRTWRVRLERIEGGADNCRLLTFRDLSASRRIDDAVRLVVELTSADTGEGFFRSLTHGLCVALGTKHSLVGVLDDVQPGVINTLAVWNDDRHGANFSYALQNTPCDDVLTQSTRCYPDNVCSRFPDEKILADFGAESYLGTPLHGYDGTVLGVLVVVDDKPMTDSTVGSTVLEIFAMRAAAEIERRSNERKLRESEARYRRMVETTREGVCVVGENARIEFLNDTMAKLAGATDRQELIGKNLWEYFDIDEGVEDRLKALANDTLEAGIQRADGEAIRVAVSKTVIRNQVDDIDGMLMMFTDVTEEYLLSEENKRIEAQLLHAQKLESLGVLAGGVAHDFNNLLMPILGYLDLIEKRLNDDAVVSNYLVQIKEAGEKLAELCNQMLTYSGKGQAMQMVFDLNEELDNLAELVRATVSKSVSIVYRKDVEPCFIKVDVAHFSQIVMNLVINSSESMEGHGSITISTGREQLEPNRLTELHNGSAVEPGEYAWLEIVDEGLGMAEKEISRLFEPFYSTKFAGRGLGMAVVFGIVRAHRGAIDVRSGVGVGTAVRVYFPAVTERTHTGPEDGDTDFCADGLVLVVDDEDYVRDILTGMLELVGYEVVTASDGAQGLDEFHLREGSITCCVIDLTMPGMNGLELFKKIREHDSDVPVILISGYSPHELSDVDVDAGNIAFLQKPFELRTLTEVLRGLTTATS